VPATGTRDIREKRGKVKNLFLSAWERVVQAIDEITRQKKCRDTGEGGGGALWPMGKRKEAPNRLWLPNLLANESGREASGTASRGKATQ